MENIWTWLGSSYFIKLFYVYLLVKCQVFHKKRLFQNNPSEFLSRLIIASSPPHTLHGSGPTPEAARDAASLTALKILNESGIVKEESPVNMAAGDG